MIWHIIFLFGFLSICESFPPDCDFYEELLPQKTYAIYSPRYPIKYPADKSCRWIAISPPNTKIKLMCNDFYIPPSQECHLDRISVFAGESTDPTLYCGAGVLHLTTLSNHMEVDFFSVPQSPGGMFMCEVEVKTEDIPPPTPPNPNCDCGLTNSRRIIGGTETGVNEYPMMAGLVDGKEKELFCGATIISKKYALTAAHCLVIKKVENTALLVGDHDISTGSDTNSARLYRTKSFQTHPKYNRDNQQNDLGLVEVYNEIEFSRTVGAACLPFLNYGNSFVGETVHALGWGATESGPKSEKLLEAPLDVITFQECEATYGDLVTDKQICTYREKKDACQSDSGGPLLWRDPYSGVVKVLGVISYGILCATHNPSVNTRVTSYLDWIKDATREDFCVL